MSAAPGHASAVGAPSGEVMRWGTRSLVVNRRSVTATAVTVALVVVVFCVLLLVGEVRLTPEQVWRTFTGHGTRGEEFLIYSLRLPRALTAICVGMAFGISGGIFQSLTRNPLGSPDIIGFTQGAALGAVIVLLGYHGSQLEASAGALVGGLVVSVAVYLLAYRNGVQGYRLVLVGIGMSAILLSLVSYMLLRAEVEDAQGAFVWLTGSLNNSGWRHVYPAAAALAVLVPLAMASNRRMRILELGDESACAMGVPVERTRLWLLFIGTSLCAVATASAGPVAFVALAAPQIARRLAGNVSGGILPAAAMGALIMLVSDLAAQRALAPTQLPVGVATLAIGGAYLGWLLFRENRAGRG